VTLIPGDGIGKEITDSVKEIFEHVNAPIEWEQYDVSGETSGGESLFKEALESLKRNKVGLKGTCYYITPLLHVNSRDHPVHDQAFSILPSTKPDTTRGMLP